jgi:hypothetical protein
MADNQQHASVIEAESYPPFLIFTVLLIEQ